jgi:hypothetical protein
MASFVAIFFLFAIKTIFGYFLTLSMALLDKIYPGKSNGIGFSVIGYTMCTLEQFELSFANFLFTLYTKCYLLSKRRTAKQKNVVKLDYLFEKK